MQRMNDCYVIDEADVPVVIKHLNTAGYHAIPHWYLTHYAKAVTICSTRHELHIDADKWVWRHYASLFNAKIIPL
jgi:hypothetical protein